MPIQPMEILYFLWLSLPTIALINRPVLDHALPAMFAYLHASETCTEPRLNAKSKKFQAKIQGCSTIESSICIIQKTRDVICYSC